MLTTHGLTEADVTQTFNIKAVTFRQNKITQDIIFQLWFYYLTASDLADEITIHTKLLYQFLRGPSR